MQQHLRIFLIIAFFLTGYSTLSAQDESSATDSLSGEIRGIIRHSFIHWMDPIVPSALVGIDYRIGDHKYLRHELAYIFDLGYEEPQALTSLSGFRLRTAYRKYHQAPQLSRRLIGYLEFSADYRYLDVGIDGDFRRDAGNFRQRINYHLWQHSVSLNLLAGMTVPIGAKWLADFGVGGGVRLNHRRYSEVPDDALFITNGVWYLWNYDSRADYSFAISMPIILALCYQW